MSKSATTRPGGLLVNKPAGITSHDVVAQVRRLLPRGAKVGHSGTLDPFATGVLIVLLGSATRLVEYLHELPKTYRATVTLGATSTTDDSTGTLTVTSNKQPLVAEISDSLAQFRGAIDQVPPRYAAIKVAGKKLYEYAREGTVVKRRPRRVEIYDLTVLEYEYPRLELTVTCSSGTYIRALARDIGEAVYSGGYLSQLTRTAIGPWKITAAKKLAELTPETLSQLLLSPRKLVAHMPQTIVSPENVVKLRQGRAVDVAQKLPSDTPLALFDDSQNLIGVGHIDSETALLYPDKILP